MLITILTPTYNREQSIYRLWESLKLQSKNCFEWVIVDDGSTDGTRELISKLSSESDFEIRYFKKQNGGKHTALNLGIAEALGNLVFIVDSDDWLTEDAVETIVDTNQNYLNEPNICGYSFLRQFPNGEINGAPFKESPYITSYIEARINSNDTHSDKAEVYLTSVLKEFPFPEYNGEKFLGEDIVWIRIARKYDMVHINKSIYIGSYQADGLTNNRRIHNIQSPIGCFYRACEFTYPDIAVCQRIKGALQMIVYGKFAGKTFKQVLSQSHAKSLTVALIPAGLAIYRKWNRSINNQ